MFLTDVNHFFHRTPLFRPLIAYVAAILVTECVSLPPSVVGYVILPLALILMAVLFSPIKSTYGGGVCMVVLFFLLSLIHTTRLQQNHPSAISLFAAQAAQWRADLCEHYSALHFQGDELAVASAITLGDKSLISVPLRNLYSVTGASHVLALSGMHLGIIYTLFFSLLRWFPQRRWAQWLRVLLLCAALWGFAWLVGFSTSIVRAATMFTLLGVARCLQRHNINWNILSATALIMLVFRSSLLFEIGFQMSFMAVAGIFLFYKPLRESIKLTNPLVRRLWSLIMVSLAAQIGIAPLVMHHFGYLSPYFLLTNLVVIPLVTLLLTAAIPMWLLTFCPTWQQWVADAMQAVIHFQHTALQEIVYLPYASVEVTAFGWGHVAIFYAISFLLYLCFKYRKKEL